MKVFLEEISIGISKLNEVDGPPQCKWASPNPWRAWIELEEKGQIPLSEAYIFSYLGTLVLLVLRAFRLGLNYTPLTVLGFQLVDGRLWDFLAFMITWVNSYFSFYIYIYAYQHTKESTYSIGLFLPKYRSRVNSLFWDSTFKAKWHTLTAKVKKN